MINCQLPIDNASLEKTFAIEYMHNPSFDKPNSHLTKVKSTIKSPSTYTLGSSHHTTKTHKLKQLARVKGTNETHSGLDLQHSASSFKLKPTLDRQDVHAFQYREKYSKVLSGSML